MLHSCRLEVLPLCQRGENTLVSQSEGADPCCLESTADFLQRSLDYARMNRERHMFQFLWPCNTLLPEVLEYMLPWDFPSMGAPSLSPLTSWGVLKNPHSHSGLKSCLYIHQARSGARAWPVPCSPDLCVLFPIGHLHLDVSEWHSSLHTGNT